MIAGMVLTNLMYVAGAVAVATVISAFVLLRHRRPRSLESSIELFSRELKALEPDGSGPRPASGGSSRVTGAGGVRPSRPAADPTGPVSAASTSPVPKTSGAVRRLVPGTRRDAGAGNGIDRDGATAPSPEQESQPG